MPSISSLFELIPNDVLKINCIYNSNNYSKNK